MMYMTTTPIATPIIIPITIPRLKDESEFLDDYLFKVIRKSFCFRNCVIIIF